MKLSYLYNFIPSDFFSINDDVYICTKMYTSVLCVNLRTGVWLYKENIEDISDENSKYSSVFIYDDKMIFVPRYGNEILIYNTKNNERKLLDLNIDSVSWGKTSDALLSGDLAYFIPEKESELIVFDCNRGEICNRINLDVGEFLRNECDVRNHRVYIPSHIDNRVYIIPDGGKSINTINCQKQVQRIISGKDDLFVVDHEGVLYRTDDDLCRFDEICNVQGEIYVISNTLINVDIEKNAVYCIMPDGSRKKIQRITEDEIVIGCRKRNDIVLILSYDEGRLILESCDSSCMINRRVADVQMIDKMHYDGRILMENQQYDISLNRFLKGLSAEDAG